MRRANQEVSGDPQGFVRILAVPPTCATAETSDSGKLQGCVPKTRSYNAGLTQIPKDP